MAKFTLTNESLGARGLVGGILVDAGKKVTGVELTADEVTALELYELLIVKPEKK